eukprot:CAMPEP_0118862830 /NCGR_PEP_ID=MMETSP1163-20130328/7910_1 /TAXON_ID=124430 /ORGANISM="Phaeomonas parva, Strain CCMP2877" /LENGTH=244 /DNA_ID=CAMNT_0006796773 /DNA_START=13 /DNA_END=744 /DNA_ORIENTATION=-
MMASHSKRMLTVKDALPLLNQRVIQNVSAMVHPLHMQAEDTLITTGNFVTQMYMLTQGAMRMQILRDLEPIVCGMISSSCCIGLHTLLENVKANYTIIAEKESDLYFMNDVDLYWLYNFSVEFQHAVDEEMYDSQERFAEVVNSPTAPDNGDKGVRRTTTMLLCGRSVQSVARFNAIQERTRIEAFAPEHLLVPNKVIHGIMEYQKESEHSGKASGIADQGQVALGDIQPTQSGAASPGAGDGA